MPITRLLARLGVGAAVVDTWIDDLVPVMPGSIFTARIKNFNELVINHPDYQFLLWRDARESGIKGKVGLEEIAKLNGTKNGKFKVMDKNARIQLELIYATIIDIQNQDLEFDLNQDLQILSQVFPESWLTIILTHSNRN